MLTIMPDSATFSIWGLIYTLLMFASVYMMLPESVMTDRNNEFLFEEIGWLWLINMIMCIFWWIFALTNTMVS